MTVLGASPSTIDTIEGLLHSEVDRSANMCSDTRLLVAGDIFLAYPVGSGDGLADNRTHIPKALELGASIVLYETQDWAENQYIEARAVLGDSRCIPVHGLSELAGPIADRWYKQPSAKLNVIGVTGTNGKTTITHWLAQVFQKMSATAVIGTIGYGDIHQLQSTGFTTPDASRVQRILAQMLESSIKTVAMEVSSHALEQGRVNGVRFKTAVFTNLSQDHLDYHGDMQSYEQAKLELFRWPNLEHIVLNIDDPVGSKWATSLCNSSAKVWVYGSEENWLQLPETVRQKLSPILLGNVLTTHQGIAFEVTVENITQNLNMQLFGGFNAHNAVAVLGVLIANGVELDKAFKLIENLKPVSGRLDLVNKVDDAKPLMVVDYAHTPDALEKALSALRPVASIRNGKLFCVFGCGGNRDKGKRPQMGRIAARLADRVIVTSDNPRFEKPQDIIDQIIAGVEPANTERVTSQVDRAFAILWSVKQAQSVDVVLVAGKGHEKTQEIDGKKFPFSDYEHIQLAIRGIG